MPSLSPVPGLRPIQQIVGPTPMGLAYEHRYRRAAEYCPPCSPQWRVSTPTIFDGGSFTIEATTKPGVEDREVSVEACGIRPGEVKGLYASE